MAENPGPTLQRKLGVFNATTINMSNMVGIGPFTAIPIILGTLGGPHSYLAWLVGVIIAMADGLVVYLIMAKFQKEWPFQNQG